MRPVYHETRLAAGFGGGPGSAAAAGLDAVLVGAVVAGAELAGGPFQGERQGIRGGSGRAAVVVGRRVRSRACRHQAHVHRGAGTGIGAELRDAAVVAEDVVVGGAEGDIARGRIGAGLRESELERGLDLADV